MTADPLLLPDAAPSLVSAALRAGGMILGLVALAVGWLLWQRRERRAERKMKIEDRLALHRGASVVLMQVDDQRLLVGVTADGIRLLRTLPALASLHTANDLATDDLTATGATATAHSAAEALEFADALHRAGEPAEAAS